MPPITKMRRRTHRILHGPKLPLALTGAIMVSLALTIISVVWYNVDGSSKLDLSRPGYEHERTEVLSNDTQKTYDTTGQVTKSAINDFLNEYDGRAKELGGYGSFSDQALDDTNIQLKPQNGGSATQ